MADLAQLRPTLILPTWGGPPQTEHRYYKKSKRMALGESYRPVPAPFAPVPGVLGPPKYSLHPYILARRCTGAGQGSGLRATATILHAETSPANGS